MKKDIRVLVCALAVGALSVPAFADRDSRRDSGQAITLPQSTAIEIARQNGVAEIRETRARRGVWKIEGWTEAGDKIEIRLDGQSGEVVSVETYGPSSHHHRSGDDDSRRHR